MTQTDINVSFADIQHKEVYKLKNRIDSAFVCSTTTLNCSGLETKGSSVSRIKRLKGCLEVMIMEKLTGAKSDYTGGFHEI